MECISVVNINKATFFPYIDHPDPKSAALIASSISKIGKRRKSKKSIKHHYVAATHAMQQQMLADTRVLRSILRQIAAESGFLIENKLLDLLQPYMPTQKTVVLVDNVFCVSLDNFP